MMKIKGGYMGKILFIDLTTGKIEKKGFSDEFALKYVGGRGFGAKLIWDNLRRHNYKIDPLGPENLIVIASGPLSGFYLPASGKTSFIAISPSTGIYGDSSMGGSFGIELKQAGYDAIAISGRADKLSYIWIDNDEISIIPCKQLKGKNCIEVEGVIKKDIGDIDIKIACIGVAGENLVKFACITTEMSRNAGRTGMGAVLGSKNIKAIVVRGSKDLPVYDLKKLCEESERGYKELKRHKFFELWQEQGLMSVVEYVNDLGVFPSYNFKDGYFERANKIDGYEMVAKYKIGDTACFACPMACGNMCLVKEGKYIGTVTEGPEYETTCMLGSNVGVDNFGCILKANRLCDDFGIDTISCGNLIGAIIEGYEIGILTLKDVDNIPLKWGDEQTILKLIEKIAYREGIGDIIAEGSRGVINKWPELKPLVLHTKGLEQSAYEARVAISMALGYGTSDIGAHHTRAWPLAKELEEGMDWDLKKKAELVIYHQTVRPLFDMLGVCRLPWIELGFSEGEYAKYYTAITGVECSLEELCERSKAIYDLTRLIITSLGVTRKDDYPPEKNFTVPIHSGPQAGKVLSREEYEKILDIYYELRGWDKNGIPDEKVKDKFNDELE